ncbi:MAG TPA: hypothetical protein VHD87_04580 [Acidimicrobiales bacterium]|nr:hypothetical protein [Acidimicrobiales bacterium]
MKLRRALGVVLALAVAGGAGVVAEGRIRARLTAPCHVVAVAGTQSTGYDLDLAQAANATTIAAVGKRFGLPDHAVTVALSAALLESGLHNLDHGDRDSLGLFQQRPSQGWGTPAQILTPRYAAAAFFEHLAKVPHWETLPVTVAAQRVQHSALPNGYAQEEGKARALASALTGEVPAGMACRASIPHTPPAGTLTDAMAAELGVRSLATPSPPARGWTVALWLVGHARDFRVTSVHFSGMRWTAAGGKWTPDASATSEVRITTAV